MNNEEIKIVQTLNEDQKIKVARIFFNSFPKKFEYLWLFTKNEEQAIECLRNCINYDSGLYAISNNSVYGLIGLETGGSRYVELKLKELKKVFGTLGGIWRYIGYKCYRLAHNHSSDSEVHIDPIAVAKEAQGKGIGSKLLDAAFNYAKNIGKRTIVLEVVDTNPRAKKLYERVGFTVIDQDNFGIITYKAGFKSVINMKKELA
ncbi:acetyltransferase, GNAT family [Gottschalkia acidurici 9a]|uniref:Acetyltransferase, GNAT family n=1 Tax=Gottschalkia acidurici (strain ATCC 7906 / DSM 604 / BCRC 14475 / CIP 104303 / KCTC 5404 / NCIMB 10678 / 9a) TaxID=1128398 RepID=K0B5F9_GOTA9|nr:GNAT family N-acetyltransferase [Gottschalkia acidurici]AFS79771.1 acetyltransferase, GNAT family [Gottschalkia acidurici 9a]